MKNLLLILFLFFSSLAANAQFSENNAIYYSGSLELGNYLGIDMNANYVLKEKYSFRLGFAGFVRNPKAAPSDYSSGLLGAMTFGLANPYDQLNNFQIAAGRIISMNKKGTIRANLSAGIALTNIKETYNWQRVEVGGFLTPNYTYDYHDYNTFSLIINPKIEFPFTRFYGLTLSPLLIINKDRTYVGLGIGQMVGLLRKKNVENTDNEN